MRQALATLVTEGLIKKQRGKGSIVQHPKGGIGILNIVGTTDSLGDAALETHVISPPSREPWPDDFPFALTERLRAMACVQLTRTRHIEGTPVFFERTFLPDEHIAGFERHDLTDASLFRTLSKYHGIKVTGGKQRIWALAAAREIAEHLACDPGQPIVRLYKAYETNRPGYTFFTMLWCRTDHHHLLGYL